MSTMHMPGLDPWLTSPDEPRRPKYRTPEEAQDAIASEILADRDRMMALLEEHATEQDEAERLDELNTLRYLLGRSESDTRIQREIAQYRRDFASMLKDVAEAEAKMIVDGEASL